MKKIVIMGIALLFLVVGFEYAIAQPANIGAKFTSFTPKITYQQRLFPKNIATETDGAKFVNVNSPIKAKSVFDPVLYVEVDPVTGNPTEFNIFWKNVADSDDHILALYCPFPAMIIAEAIAPRPDDEDSVVAVNARRPEIGVDTIQGNAVCFFCPSGIITDVNGEPSPVDGNLVCNNGLPQPSIPDQLTAVAFLSFKGTLREKRTDETPIDFRISGTISGGGFDYLGQTDWASPNCITTFPDSPPDFPCPGLLNVTFSATLLPCPAGNPQCENLYLPVLQE